ncbi:MAG: glycosyl transferase family 1 [Herbinix sp.]|jgi:glycosyltransferase involved in cell wall biosynthesis|nr:glycosyl transferase family 1 [Herbinix sp.]
MKILWLTNYALPMIAEALGNEKIVNEGWLIGLSKQLMMNSDVELTVVYPQSGITKQITGITEKLRFYGYPELSNKIDYNILLKQDFIEIIYKEKPDVIHIMGSEFPHCYSMVEACIACDYISRAVISIQGLVSICIHHYDLGLPHDALHQRSIRDIIKRDSLQKYKKELYKRGRYEVLALSQVKNVIGRTDWDRACTMQINPEVKYYFNNETLRPPFYGKLWSQNECEPYSLFISQGNNPIKGLHFALKALPLIRKRYPNVKLYIAGSEVLKKKQSYPKWKRKAYENFLFELIENDNLSDNIVFCGTLNETQMCERYLKSNVYISPSLIENSPNSIGEAMLLGVPVVASDVGGVKNLLVHGKEGFIYQADAFYMLAYYVCEILSSKELAKKLSNNAMRHATVTHNALNNAATLISIYHDISFHAASNININELDELING